jgi:nitric oxide reductase activation protein
MQPDTLETLRQVNDNLRSALLRLRPEQKHCSSITPQDFFDILSQILRAAECLRHLPPHSDAEKESLAYQTNLENLKHFLPDLHERLLAEKARLENAQLHVAAATAWARARKKTL